MPKPATKKKQPSLTKGNRVSFDLDGETMLGTILKVGTDSVEVKADDKQTYECEFDELTLVEAEPDEPEEEEKPKKALPGKKAKPAVDDDEEETPKKKSSSTKSLAKAFNAAEKKDRASFGLPVGTHEVLVCGGQAAETDKGINAYIEFVGVNDPDIEGKTQRKTYFLFDAEGEPNDGIGYFKADLIDLGVDEDDISIDEDVTGDLNIILKKLTKMCPWLAVRVAPQKNDSGYTNIFIQGLMEDQDEKPEMPDI